MQSDPPSAIDLDTLVPEREHLERALAERFNFFLVWVGLITAAAFMASKASTRALILFFGCIVSILLMLALNRTAGKAADLVDLMREKIPDHAVCFSKDPSHRWWIIPSFKSSVFILVGLVVPLISAVGLLCCAIGVCLGWLG